MIENSFPDLQTRTTKYCPHDGCAYGLVVEWYPDAPLRYVTMPRPQMDWLLQRHLESHLDPSVHHS